MANDDGLMDASYPEAAALRRSVLEEESAVFFRCSQPLSLRKGRHLSTPMGLGPCAGPDLVFLLGLACPYTKCSGTAHGQ